MSTDENASIRQKLWAWWKATEDVFTPSPPDVDGGRDNHPKSETYSEHTERLHRTGIQPSYRGGWRNLASVVSLVGSAMFGASFNFLSHNDVAFFAVAAFGIGFMLFGVWATSKHDQLEQRTRDDMAKIERKQQVAQQRAMRIQRVSDIYLATMRELEQTNMTNEYRIKLLIRGGVLLLEDDGETREVLKTIGEHGFVPPPLQELNEIIKVFFPQKKGF